MERRSPDGISYSPGDDTFFSQIEEWNEKDEYTKSIRALEAIPEEQQDYRIKMLLVSAYENYAIIGDNDEGTERWKGDRVLLKAIRLMETVRDEGEKNANWNMRMAYAYQYLMRQEEKAIEYAKRWRNLIRRTAVPRKSSKSVWRRFRSGRTVQT
mgnify:FL=1